MQWYFKPHPLDEANPDRETGPISFRDLTALVRAGAITEDNLVRSELSKIWQHADTVVGLFYMSRIAQIEPEPVESVLLPDPSHATQPAGANPLGDEPNAEIDAEFEQPGWMKRLVGLTRARPASPAQPKRRAVVTPPTIARLDAPRTPAVPSVRSSPVGTAPSPADKGLCADIVRPGDAGASISPNSATWSVAVGAAIAAADARKEGRDGTNASRPWGIRSNRTLSIPALARLPRFLPYAFRVGAAFVCANIAAWWVLDWSAREAMRFPDPRTTQKVFPFMGQCSPAEYSMLLLDLVLFVAVTAYAAAYWLESRAQDD